VLFKKSLCPAERGHVRLAQYYSYTVDSPYAKNGTHNLAVATAKDNAVYLFVVSASDKQWAANENVLRTIQESFSV
jgi:hypothetical protein